MKTSVELQDPFSYMIIWIILAVLFIAAVIFAQLYFRKVLGDRLKKPRTPKLKKVPPATLDNIKRKYLGELTYIESDLVNNRITIREAYHKFSKNI